MKHPFHMPCVRYSQIVDEFIEDVYKCCEESGVQKYSEILNENNIEWDKTSMSTADASGLSKEVILALLLGAVRAERFCDGALLAFLEDGSIQRWLIELKEKRKMAYIKLNDILGFSDPEINNVKIRFHQTNSFENPMELYLQNPDIVNSQWLFWRTKQRYFNVGQIAVCLLKLSYDTWLLTTIKRVTKELNVFEGINYEGEELLEYSQYFGRVIVKFHKKAQTQGMFYNTVCDELEVLEILPNMFDGDEFPGYDRVRLSYSQLSSIVERQKKSWIAALEN